jgi:hypothetical protein
MASTAMRKYQKAEATNKSLRGKISKMRRDFSASKMPNALYQGGLVIAGGASAGALKAVAGEELAGIDTGVIGGLVTGTAGVALGMPWMISLGSGMLVPYVHDYVQDTIAGMLEDSNAQQAGPRAVAQ